MFHGVVFLLWQTFHSCSMTRLCDLFSVARLRCFFSTSLAADILPPAISFLIPHKEELPASRRADMRKAHPANVCSSRDKDSPPMTFVMVKSGGISLLILSTCGYTPS